MTTMLNSLKRNVFYELLDLVGRVFIVVNYAPDVLLGKRTFSEEEKRSGLTLVFTPRMPVQWDELGMNATLTFGERAQKCFIPSSSIVAVYSPELQVQLTAVPQAEEPAITRPVRKEPRVIDPARLRRGPRRAAIGENGAHHGKLIEVDFANKLKRRTDDAPGKEEA
ncbi:MAG TPA: hypothetical protein VLH56_02630 [Dissulfurispiraceae bacterium]|nr:hypothetical protein [Dissulfurispiraceae bacterium]